jgi:hypothetical protein
VSKVIPFPKPKKEEPAHCSDCGWLMPTDVLVERGAVREELLLHIRCPECGATLLLLCTFQE